MKKEGQNTKQNFMMGTKIKMGIPCPCLQFPKQMVCHPREEETELEVQPPFWRKKLTEIMPAVAETEVEVMRGLVVVEQ